MNASLGEQGLCVHSDINIGIAVDTPEGLIVPVVKNARAMGLRQLVGERVRVVNAARSGRINLADLEGGTFTVTNLGPFGVDAFSPLINPPETAILGIGRVISKPWVVEGAIAVRQVGTLSLVFDHRAVDGGPAAHFLADVAHFIEEPYRLLV
jgi:pyruvate dehydrogenase E2 component (dihydrolipoamide acetyltransferase)